MVSSGQIRLYGDACAQYDILRLESGKILEYWDNKEVLPKIEALTNRDKF